METYALFMFFEDEPGGGVNDLVSIGSMDDCIAKAEASSHELAAQVVVLPSLEVVKYGGWVCIPRDRVSGLTADVGKIDWHYTWANA